MKYKLITILGALVLLGVLLAYSIARYGDALVFEQIGKGKIGAAYRSSNGLLKLVSITHGRSSERYATIAVSTSREFALRTPYFIGASAASPTALAKLASSLKDDERSARLFIEAAKLANMSFHPELARMAATKALERLHDRKEKLYDEIIIERSYAHLISLGEPIERQPDWNEIVQREYRETNARICTRDVNECRFNEIRWSIGSCIRDMVIHSGASCIQNEVMIKLGRKRICEGIEDEHCQAIVQELQPYIFELISIVPQK